MAVQVASVSTTNFSSAGNSVAIAKPAGLAIGDLMVAHIAGHTNNPMGQTPPTGWTRVISLYNNGGESWSIFTKVADASDLDLTSFTFFSGNFNTIGGAIARITGADPSSQIYVNQQVTGGIVHTFTTADLTPSAPNSLIMIFAFAQGDSSGLGGYACVNDNPAWTEAYEYGGGSLVMSMAWAVRPQVSSTGDFVVTSNTQTSIDGFFMAIAPAEVPSTSPSASRSPSASISPSASASVSPSASASPSLSPSASRSLSVSVSPSASLSASVSPSPSPGVDVYNTSIITAVKRVQQNLSFPQFVMGGKGGVGGTSYELFKKASIYGFSIFRFPVQKYSNEFDIIEIKFPIVPGLASNMNILPVLYFDNESKIITGNQININNYPIGTDFIILTSKSFGNSVRGKSNFFLELRWIGTALATIGLPVKFTAEVMDD